MNLLVKYTLYQNDELDDLLAIPYAKMVAK